jgi:hypothetical protein
MQFDEAMPHPVFIGQCQKECFPRDKGIAGMRIYLTVN